MRRSNDLHRGAALARPRAGLAARASLGVGAFVGLLLVVWLVGLGLLAGDAQAAQSPVGLGTADSFAVLGGSTVTNTGPSTINGDLGLSPGTSVTGFPPGSVNGTIHAADAVAGQAQSDLTTAYNDAASRTPAVTVTSDLGGLTLTAGVYKSDSSLALTGALTLDAQGNPNAVFVFQAGSTLTTATSSRVNLINGAQSCNVVWQVGSSATLHASTAFAGNILAQTSISLDDSVTVNGRALARSGAVTLINDKISAAHCAAATGGGSPAGGSPGAGSLGAGSGAGSPGAGSPGSPGAGGGIGVGGPGQNGTALLTTEPRSVATSVTEFGTGRCVRRSFHATVTGLFIRQVAFSVRGRTIKTVAESPFSAFVPDGSGVRTLTARVSFTDSTPVATLTFRFRACAAARRSVPHRSPSRPPRRPSGFTG